MCSYAVNDLQEKLNPKKKEKKKDLRRLKTKQICLLEKYFLLVNTNDSSEFKVVQKNQPQKRLYHTYAFIII